MHETVPRHLNSVLVSVGMPPREKTTPAGVEEKNKEIESVLRSIGAAADDP